MYNRPTLPNNFLELYKLATPEERAELDHELAWARVSG